MKISIQITTVTLTDAKEETLLDLYFNTNAWDERLDIREKLSDIHAVWALGMIALNVNGWDERQDARQRIAVIGGTDATLVLGEIAKKAKGHDERQHARDLLMET